MRSVIHIYWSSNPNVVEVDGHVYTINNSKSDVNLTKADYLLYDKFDLI